MDLPVVVEQAAADLVARQAIRARRVAVRRAGGLKVGGPMVDLPVEPVVAADLAVAARVPRAAVVLAEGPEGEVAAE